MEVYKHKNLDQVFRDKLQNHEVAPPAHIWEGIQADGLTTYAARSNSWRWWVAAGIIAFILGNASYLYFSSDSTEAEKSLSKQNTESAELQILESATHPDVTSSEIIDNSEEVEQEQELIEEIEQSFEVEEQIEQVVHNVSDSKQEVIQNVSPIMEENSSESEFIAKTFDGEEIESKNAYVTDEISNQIPGNNNNDNQQANKAGYDFFDEDVTDDIMRGHNEYKRWELGIEFSPEWITIPENDNNITSYGLDFSTRYHFSKWFVETGIGAALSKDDGLLGIDYTETVLKGSYHDVYNVTFDTSGNTPTPIYHTKLVTVYDSIDKYTVNENKNTYAYLNIPINIGYNTKLGKKIAFYAKTGIISSFKIYEHIPDPEVEGSIKKIYYLYHIRTPWHMQAQLNVGVHYYITDKFIFGVEPNARYYIKSLVEDNPGGNPYGFGVKIGFKYVIKK